MAIALFAIAPLATAQVTTGNLAGSVTARGDGSALPGVTIEATHVPTGTHYTAVSGANGRFTIPNVRVGGPYRISGSLEGFRPFSVENIEVALGTTTEVPVQMALAAVAEAITVTASADEIINPGHTGSTSAVSTQQIETLPTVNRSLQDFARTNPYFTVESWDASSTRMTVAGRNNRYNTIQIDGAVNNDLFGLADTGTPGGQTNTQPISLDAIQQIQLVVSPYDVRQGGFTGGGVNAVTRSGSNKFEGSVFGSKRDQSLVGEGPFNAKVAAFDQTLYGARLGGPIVHDRLFFFVNGERNRRNAPFGVAADGTAPTNYNGSGTGSTPSASAVRDYLMSKYNYDPGSLGDINGKTNSNLFFGRLDFNLSNSHQVTLRHNYVEGVNDTIADRSTTRFRFPTAIYTISDKTNSTVAQINSVFGPNAFNEGRLNFSTIRDIRNTPVNFPTIEIGGTGPRNGAIHAGTERFSGANALDQDVLEITDDFTWIRGNHSLTFGTHNEIFSFKNLFLSEFTGYYYYPTFDAFMQDKATEYRISYATGDNPKRPTSFDVAQYGLYASDQWHVSPTVALTFGLRADRPSFADTPSFNQTVQNAIGWSTAATPSETITWSPRIGVNWAPAVGGRQQLRGGVGIFAGRTPYVWISNAFANTGIESVALACLTSANCTPPAFNPDPANQPRNLGAGGALSVDLIDPDFQFPRVLRATLGYDRELPFGIRGSVEALYSKTQKDVFYYNVNRVQNGTSPLDGRPTYTRISTALVDAPTLSNSDKGHESIYSLQLNKAFGHGFTMSASYSHQETETSFDATSSRAISNWQFRPTPGDIFAQNTYRSQFEVPNRFSIAATWDVSTGPLTHAFGLYYDAKAGHPYSLLMGGDPNKDLFTSNDLLFVPENMILCPSSVSNSLVPVAGRPCGGTATAPVAALDNSRFYNYLTAAGVDARGRTLEANELNEPWARELDFHYELGLPAIRGARAQVQFDILNLLNMFDQDQGVVKSVVNQTFTPVNYLGQDPTTGLPGYKEASTGFLNPGRQYSTANLRSRWQGRLGFRVTF
jgi:hypothetical protein